jgi:uncharacterized membrane protein YccF (DUF307 family)
MRALGFGRAVVGVVVLAVASFVWAASPAAAADGAAESLVDAYSPIVMMRTQLDGVCDKAREQYGPPTSVNVVLGNPRVRLLERVGHRTLVIGRAPRAVDLGGRGQNFYLDLPGNPLRPGCTYARDFAALRRAGRAPAIVYAHIARQAGFTGLAVQYWFYYYFNQFNDLHESDWEGMQITFDAGTPAQALSRGPDQIVVFQHSGGEHTDWLDSRVQRSGTHPIVYSASGSHATFYSSALWLGTGQNGSGVGCDNTTEPLTAFDPRVVLLPNSPRPTGKFAWLDYSGHWGEREAGFNDGPRGPNTKTVWGMPFSWMDGTRTASPKVPADALVGPAVSSTFCGAVASVSSFINLKAQTPVGAAVVATALAAAILLALGLTHWRPTAIEPLRQARAGGQIILTAARVYARHLGSVVVIVLAALLAIGFLDGLEWLLRHALGASSSGTSLTDAGPTFGPSPAASIGRTVATPFASAVVIAFVRNLERSHDTGLPAAVMAVLRRLWRLVAVQLLILVAVAALAVTIIGIPFALLKFVDWQFAQQEILFEDRSIPDALRGSTRLVRHHRWHTATVVATFWALSQLPSVLLGAALIFTSIPAGDLNLIGALAYALLICYTGIGRTLLYLDLSYRQAHDPARVRRSRLSRRLQGLRSHSVAAQT